MRKIIKKNFVLLIILLLFILNFILNAQIKKPKVLIIATGGTIACVKTKDGLRPAYKPQELINMIPELKKYANLEGILLFNLDSTNMQPNDWIKIAKTTFLAQLRKDINGIVILHGTDTMAYTSSMLTLMIKYPKIPIILTGAQRPITDKHTDAKKNLLDSIIFATYNLPGIYIVFNGKIILGNKATKVNPNELDAFESINYPLVGKIEKEKVILNPFFEKKRHNRLLLKREPYPVLDTNINSNVLIIKITPGYKPSWLRMFLNKDIKGIIIEGFGVGNIPNREPYNLLPILKEFVSRKIPVVIMSQCLYSKVNMNLYEVGVKAFKLGLISGKNLTKEYALCKLMWILAHTNDLDKIKKFIENE